MNETIEQRVDRLERVCQLQQALIDRLAIATNGHQKSLEALLVLAGAEFQQQPAQPAPLTSMN